MKRFNILFVLALSVAVASCNKWLDVMPDNRAEVDSKEKIAKLLVSAYAESDYVVLSDMMSDNMDDLGKKVDYYERVHEQMWSWGDITETDNDDPKQIWGAYYSAITNANQALQAIYELGDTKELAPYKGEALISRAYHHFILAQLFCKGYNPLTAHDCMAIPYMEAPETELFPKYDRGNLADFYSKCQKDIEEALPLINDGIYSVPKYHFNQKAAYTFASRFYLFTGQYDEAIECSNKVLGSSAKEMLRDYATLKALPKDLQVVPLSWASTSAKNNFLLQTSYSFQGMVYGNYYYEWRYTQNLYLCATEMLNCAPWGTQKIDPSNYDFGKMYQLTPYVYVATDFNKIVYPPCYNPRMFEYTDPVAQIGFYRSLSVHLNAEEALLNRAEAYIMKEEYANALADLNLWATNTLNLANCSTKVLTVESIKAWADSYEYYDPEKPTPKKRLNPLLFQVEEGSEKEAMLLALVYIRRVEFAQQGMRLFDLKRFGIEWYRREVIDFKVTSVFDTMTVNDERRAMQIPRDVITAGFTPNPR